MKSSILSLLTVFLVVLGMAQQPFHEIPCFQMPANYFESFEGYESYNCIEIGNETGEILEDNFENKTIEAKESIELKPEVSILPNPNDPLSEFRALITGAFCLNLVWYEPYSTPGFISCYDKLEIGVELPSTIAGYIQNFIDNFENNNNNLQPTINPFNRHEIDLEMTVQRVDYTTMETDMEYTSIGFYFQDFDRDNSAQDATDWTWNEVQTNHNFRFRYTPRLPGTYEATVSLQVDEQLYCNVGTFTFEVTEGNWRDDFVRVSENNHYFQIGKHSGPNEIFFPIGLNLADDCKCEMNDDLDSNQLLTCDECYYEGCSDVCATLYFNDREGAYMTTEQTPVLAHMMKFEERINDIADAGANSFRMMWQPHMYDLEFEKVGNYCKRLTSAWEFDHLVNLCKDKELRIEVCQQIHHTLELQAHYSRFNWDWGFENICGPNPSFAYRDEFGLTDPLAFLTDEEAKDWYKNKLRYIYARWGYSTNIYLWDLFSEMNNIGYESETNIDCSAGGDVNESLPYDAEGTKEDYRIAISNWNEEMSAYIKNDLNQKNQLLTTCYAGKAPLANGCDVDCFDDTFCGENIDVVSWNAYSLGHERWKGMGARQHIPLINMGNDYWGGDYYRIGQMSCDAQYDFYEGANTTWISNKPIINSENGLGDAHMECDETGWYKDLYVSAFSGRASSGMSWDETGNSDIWPEFGKLRYFLENYFFNEVDLEEDIWYPGWEEINSDELLIDRPNYVECAYLEFPEPDHRRFIGVIINRTWNHSNTNNGEAPCTDTLIGDQIVANDSKIATDIYYDSDDDLKLKFWDGNETAQTYNIEYFYPDDLDEPVATDNVNCILGKLTLKNFPPLLLSSPIVLFRAKRDGDSFNTKMAYAESNVANGSSLSMESTTLLVDSNRLTDCLFFVMTNPVADLLKIRGTCIMEDVPLTIYDLASRQVYSKEASNLIDPIDVSSLSSGVYILSINGQQIPFMKL